MEAAQTNLRAGDRLDRYELLCPIASGGMATVWLARLRGKRGFEKLFAIKTIRTELLDDPQFQEMLLDEARIASNIQHPNVAQILDLGEARDVLFIVMERVDGDSLAKIHKLLRRLGASLPLGVALRIVSDACAGLHAAHELRDDEGQPLSIVHRDVSPQNILVSLSGAAKIIDFGIAKAQNRQQGETRTGIVKGKVQYMAPEQVKKGRTVDRRADIWALGICLHELVAGKVPNDGDDHVEVIRKVLSDEPPPIAEGLPNPILKILNQSIALDPEARFHTAAAMQRALERVMDDLDVATTTTDVAAFLRAELPELEEKRRKVVTQSVEEARGREHTPTPVMNVDDDPYAPTLLGDRARLPGARDAGGRASSGQAADVEPLVIPHHSRAWFWVLLTLVAGLAGLRFAKPVLFGELLGRIGWGSAMAWLAPQGASPAASESAPVVAPSASSLAVLAAADASATADSSGPVAAHGLASPGPSTSHPPPHASASASAGTALDGGVLTVLPAVSVAPGAASSAPSASAAPSPSPSAAAMASSPPVASAAPPSTASAPAEQAPVDASEPPSPY